MLARGMFHLAQSATGDQITEYHLQAGIIACHCAAKDYESTDWQEILSLYNRLIELDNSPVVALNRAVAVANLEGPAAGIAAVEAIPHRAELNSYYLLYAILGEFEARRANFSAAAAHFRKAVALTNLQSERVFLAKRIESCEQQIAGASVLA